MKTYHRLFVLVLLTLLPVLALITLFTPLAIASSLSDQAASVKSKLQCDVPRIYATIQDAVDDPACTAILVGSGTFTEHVMITRMVTIVGQGMNNTVVDGNASDTVFRIEAGGIVTLAELMITDGAGSYGGGIYNALGTMTLDRIALNLNVATNLGGGIFNSGVMTINDSIINGNISNDDGGGIQNNGGHITINNSAFIGNVANFDGGGIHNNHGTVSLNECTIRANRAGVGGGICNNTGGSLNMTHSAFRDNSADVNGGAIASGGNLSILNSTFSDNDAGVWGGGIFNYGAGEAHQVTIISNTAVISGGGVFNLSGSVLMVTASIIANNVTADCAGLVASQGYNIASDDSCNLNESGDMNNTDPLLGPLHDNGGLTQTHLPLVGSPVIDAGDPLNCPEVDQRGVLRPQDGDGDGNAICDIGAVEYEMESAFATYLPVTLKP